MSLWQEITYMHQLFIFTTLQNNHKERYTITYNTKLLKELCNKINVPGGASGLWMITPNKTSLLVLFLPLVSSSSYSLHLKINRKIFNQIHYKQVKETYIV